MTKRKKRSSKVGLRTVDILLRMREQKPDFEEEIVEEKTDVYEDYKFMVSGNDDDEDNDGETVSTGEPEEVFF